MLTKDEKIISELIAKTYSNAEIAAKMNITKGEVVKILKSYYAKLGVKNRIQALIHEKISKQDSENRHK